MIQDIERQMDFYHGWLRSKHQLRQHADWTEITTPHLDRHNDCIQLYAKKDGQDFQLTDGGNTLSDLENSGCNLNTGDLPEILKVTLSGFGVTNRQGILEISATEENFPLQMNNLIQAVLAAGQMAHLAGREEGAPGPS